VTNSTTLTCDTPAGTPGAVDIAVTGTGGIGTGTSLFTYESAATPRSFAMIF
jgi:hypothetical protein